VDEEEMALEIIEVNGFIPPWWKNPKKRIRIILNRKNTVKKTGFT
jgi:hypothetical protein